jgi:hypothetical protein
MSIRSQAIDYLTQSLSSQNGFIPFVNERDSLGGLIKSQKRQPRSYNGSLTKLINCSLEVKATSVEIPTSDIINDDF